MDGITLETERLIIRTLVIGDAKPLFSYRSLPEVSRFQTFKPQDVDDVVDFIRSLATEPDIPDSWYPLALILRNSQEHIGDIGIHFLAKPDEVELGCTITPRLWGKGYAAESLMAVLDFVFNKLKKNRAVVDINPENTRSRLLFERLGFQMVSQNADEVIYQLLNPAA